MKEIKKLNDVFGHAIRDFYHGEEAIIETYSSIGGWDELPVDYLFRSYDKMPVLEQVALKMAKGAVLDIGCGAGSHSLYLQKQGLDVTAIDISEGAIDICKKRGLRKTELIDIWNFSSKKYDTILSLMNGAGLCGSMKSVPSFLTHLKSLLEPDGQILVDSSDVIYMFEDENGDADISEIEHYYGEVEFESKYLNQYSGRYPWLYIDFYNLQQQAFNLDMDCELIQNGPHYDFLAKITHSDKAL